MKFFSVLFCIICGFHLNRCQFVQCHDDPSYEPEEGPVEYIQYTWLGTLQYIHIKNGTPHYFRVPRVVLISRQFVLSTAKDAAHVPDGFALGNIVFGEYERDETECGVTLESITAGVGCSSAAMLMPVSDVVLHPRPDTIAILKLLIPIHSRYMIPVCLPFENYLTTRSKKEISDKLYFLDFESDVPRDIVEEDKEITKLSLLPEELCYLYNGKENVTMDMEKIMCTTGCGFHIGATSIFHEHTGHWTLLGFSLGGSPCPDPLRSDRRYSPAHHLLIHPYVPWITDSITGPLVRAIDKEDPFGFEPRASALGDPLMGHEWNGRWWMGGISCYHRGQAARHMFKFYHEVFQIVPTGNMSHTYYLEVHAAYGCLVTCIKIGLPYRIIKPTVWGLETSEVKIHIPALNVRRMYKFQIEAYAHNATKEHLDTASKSEETKED